MRYLTYDCYPFLWDNGFNRYVYPTLDRIRKSGIQYNADTGYYLQSMIITGTYPLLYDNELRYNASLGMAYGMKNYKWFVALTPVDAEAAGFETGFGTSGTDIHLSSFLYFSSSVSGLHSSIEMSVYPQD